VTNSPPDWLARGSAHVWLPYAQMQTAPLPLPVVRTKGSRIYLADGRELIDGIASWWTACHGYNHPHICGAVAHQLALMPHVMFGGLVHEPALTLARRLAALLPGGLERIFFCDSGSVAIEIAMKMAVQFWLNQGNPRRNRFVAFEGAYHGDTFGAMSVCDPDEGMHGLFASVLPRQLIARLPQDPASAAAFDSLLDQHAENLAAIIVEPLVQGAGGMRFHAPGVLRHLRAAADRHGLLLIFDEVFTGFGRTGTMFACEAAGVSPDIIALSKALTGGTIGLGAVAATKRVYDAFLSESPNRALMHGPTFMANPLACAAANASLDLFEREPRLAQVSAIEAALIHDLAPARAFPHVREVRAKGAIGVVELDRIGDLNELRRRFIDAGVFVRPFGNIVYLTPAFTISAEELGRLTGAVVSVLRQCTRL
jgi:adenosylmethionine-8-amino-7-oxononanoate aminotransferase